MHSHAVSYACCRYRGEEPSRFVACVRATRGTEGVGVGGEGCLCIGSGTGAVLHAQAHGHAKVSEGCTPVEGAKASEE